MPQSETEVAQSCLTFCKFMDCSLLGSSIHGILQARILEWVFPTQGSNLGLPHCRQTLYHLSHQGLQAHLQYTGTMSLSWTFQNEAGIWRRRLAEVEEKILQMNVSCFRISPKAGLVACEQPITSRIQELTRLPSKRRCRNSHSHLAKSS